RRRTAGNERRGGARIDEQRLAIFLGEMTIGASGAKAVPGIADRFGEQVAPGQPAETAMHRIETGYRSRDRNRQRADTRQAAGLPLRGRRGRSGPGAVEHNGAATRLIKNVIEAVSA